MNSGFKPFADKYDPIAVASIDCQDTQPHDNAVVRAINRYVGTSTNNFCFQLGISFSANMFLISNYREIH